MRKGYGFIALLTLAFGGCAAGIKDMPSAGRYMVVTRFGDGLAVTKLGMTLFNDDSRLFQDDTDLGKLFRDGTIAALGKDSSWVYVPSDVPMDPPKYDGDYGDYRSDMIGDWHKTDARLLKLKQAAQVNHVDVLIYITESKGENLMVPLGPNNEVVSRGLMKHSLLGFDDRNWAFVSYQIVVYDVRTWKSREYATTFFTPYPQFEWPKLSIPAKPLPPDTASNAKQALTKIEPPSDLSFALCYLGLTDVTHDPLDHTRAYICAQHYGLQSINMSFSDVPIYWLTHPVDTNHWNLNQQH
jgi:hypothetical protein